PGPGGLSSTTADTGAGALAGDVSARRSGRTSASPAGAHAGPGPASAVCGTVARVADCRRRGAVSGGAVWGGTVPGTPDAGSTPAHRGAATVAGPSGGRGGAAGPGARGGRTVGGDGGADSGRGRHAGEPAGPDRAAV